MSMPDNHLGERLQDLADNRLSGADLAQARAHLEDCGRCRREFEALQHVRQMLAPRAGSDELPPVLNTALYGLLDQEDRAAAASPRSRGKGATTLLWQNHKPVESDPWTTAVAQHFAAYRSAQLPLAMRSTDPARLEDFFSRHLDFHPSVYDLDKMGYQIQGGEVVRVNGRASALSAYGGPDDSRLLCEMFRGRMDELPTASRTASHDGKEFRVYRRGALTAVYWADGDIICVLVSDIDSEALLALAFAKAGPAA
jgi:anti-sigma factor RsiW